MKFCIDIENRPGAFVFVAWNPETETITTNAKGAKNTFSYKSIPSSRALKIFEHAINNNSDLASGNQNDLLYSSQGISSGAFKKIIFVKNGDDINAIEVTDSSGMQDAYAVVDADYAVIEQLIAATPSGASASQLPSNVLEPINDQSSSYGW